MRGIKVERSKNRSKRKALSTRIDCPWNTIRLLPTVTLAGHQTSLDSQPNREHPVFQKVELLPEEVQTPFVLRGEIAVPPPPVTAAAAPAAAPKPSTPSPQAA